MTKHFAVSFVLAQTKFTMFSTQQNYRLIRLRAGFMHAREY